MLSIIEVKGKQYVVEKANTILKVDRIDQAEESTYGDVKVLYHKDDQGRVLIGEPYVEQASVKAVVLGMEKGKKLLVRRYRPKSGIRKARGFRSQMTSLRIESISVLGPAPAPAAT